MHLLLLDIVKMACLVG